MASRLVRAGTARPLERIANRFHFEASDRGIARVAFGRGRDLAEGRGDKLLARARAELAEYLAGARTYFTVPLDLAGLPPFQAKVLAEASRIGFGEVDTYTAIARRIGHPHAARAVGNALAANPVPVLVPCHRVVRIDGTWGHYAFGGEIKTRLLALERATPSLVGSRTTRIVCRRGCPHERRIREDHRVVFGSLDDAERAGYRRCRVCWRAPTTPASSRQQ